MPHAAVCAHTTMRVAKSIRDIVLKSNEAIETISLPTSPDLVCKNIFCEKVTKPCLCKLEHALCSLNLSLVKSVDISGNSLDRLPPSLEKMINLEHLDVSDNKLKLLPRFLLNLPQLKHIQLNGNLMGSIDSTPLTYSDIVHRDHLFESYVSHESHSRHDT
jgi:Leucine-rich repeat (LRR) protein